jgi:hypothetical protein
LTFKLRDSAFVGPYQAKIGVPPAFRRLPQGNRNPGVNFFGAKARRQGGIGEIDGLRFLAYEQNPRHFHFSIQQIISDPAIIRAHCARRLSDPFPAAVLPCV